MYCWSVSPSVMIVLIIEFSIATSLAGFDWRCLVALRDSVWRRGSITISLAPRLVAFLMKVAATGWFTVGLAPITHMTSASAAAANGADAAALVMSSSRAASGDS